MPLYTGSTSLTRKKRVGKIYYGDTVCKSRWFNNLLEEPHMSFCRWRCARFGSDSRCHGLVLLCTCTLQSKILCLKFSLAVLSLAMFNFDLHRFQSLYVQVAYSFVSFLLHRCLTLRSRIPQIKWLGGYAACNRIYCKKFNWQSSQVKYLQVSCD